jgi:hypothetical protein
MEPPRLPAAALQSRFAVTLNGPTEGSVYGPGVAADADADRTSVRTAASAAPGGVSRYARSISSIR